MWLVDMYNEYCLNAEVEAAFNRIMKDNNNDNDSDSNHPISYHRLGVGVLGISGRHQRHDNCRCTELMHVLAGGTHHCL